VPEKPVLEEQPEPKNKGIPATKSITEPNDPNWDQDNINVMNWLLNSMEPQSPDSSCIVNLP
jgi:hypothetical protein